MKACPYCDEQIDSGATKCPFCGADLSGRSMGEFAHLMSSARTAEVMGQMQEAPRKRGWLARLLGLGGRRT